MFNKIISILNLNSKESSNTDSQFLQYIHEMSENREIDSFQLLENKYGKIIYNVGDASNFSYWDRNDFPIEQLFMENIDVATLYRWEPKNKKSNPSGFEKSIQDRLKGIKDGSRSVLIHPNIEKKMKQDPQYAKSIYNMIDTYFQNDIMINESILPGSTLGVIQFVSIDKDGNIDRTCTITNSVNQNDRSNELFGEVGRRSGRSIELDKMIAKVYGKNSSIYNRNTDILNGSENDNIYYSAEFIYGEIYKETP